MPYTAVLYHKQVIQMEILFKDIQNIHSNKYSQIPCNRTCCSKLPFTLSREDTECTSEWEEAREMKKAMAGSSPIHDDIFHSLRFSTFNLMLYNYSHHYLCILYKICEGWAFTGVNSSIFFFFFCWFSGNNLLVQVTIKSWSKLTWHNSWLVYQTGFLYIPDL